MKDFRPKEMTNNKKVFNIIKESKQDRRRIMKNKRLKMTRHITL